MLGFGEGVGVPRSRVVGLRLANNAQVYLGQFRQQVNLRIVSS